ncbi:MAG: helix-turn-helix transcriptional regulator [Raoultibacter sp.]
MIREFIDRWKSVLMRVSAIPLVFMGIGIYRAWLATFFRYDAFPGIGVFDYFIFEGAIGVASFALAFSAKKIAPIWSNRAITRATALCMVLGSTLVVLACFVLQSEILKIIGLVVAGAGLAALILMWAEFYGSMNPMRVALYHAMGIFFGEVIKWLFLGMSAPYLAFFAIVLPLVSIAWVKSSMRRLPEYDLPRKVAKSESFAFPWKPILLMSVCTFAGGFGALPGLPLVPGNVVGALLVTALVFFGVLSESKWFNFDTIYQLAFPLFIIGFLLVMPTFGSNPEVMAVCYDAGYTMLSMFIVIVLSSITYRFGISAVWLSGIERGIRYVVELLGWGAFVVVSGHATQEMTSMIYTGLVIVMVVVFTVIFFTERGLSAQWGIEVDTVGPLDKDQSPVAQAARLSVRVSALSKKHNLSPREDEVLQLLARKETVSQIEQDLFVAEGTIKAHISRIYRKLDVHSRDALYELLDSEGGLASSSTQA